MAIRPADTFADIPEVAGRRARWWAATKDFVRKRPLGAIGAAIVLLNIIVALGANVFAAYDPLATDYGAMLARPSMAHWLGRSEEHTSELQSQSNLVCRLLLEKKKNTKRDVPHRL